MSKKWELLWSEAALKDLRKLDKQIAKIIVKKTSWALNNIDDPKLVLEPLKYARKGQYKYRVGNYRIICRMIDDECIIEAIALGHRRDIYK